MDPTAAANGAVNGDAAKEALMSSDKKLADESTFAGDESVEGRTGIDKSERDRDRDRDEEEEGKGEGVAGKRTAVPPRKRHTSLSPQRSNGTAGGSRLQPLFGGTTSATAAAHATHAATHATHAEEEAFSSIVSAAEATKSGYVLDRTKKKLAGAAMGAVGSPRGGMVAGVGATSTSVVTNGGVNFIGSRGIVPSGFADATFGVLSAAGQSMQIRKPPQRRAPRGAKGPAGEDLAAAAAADHSGVIRIPNSVQITASASSFSPASSVVSSVVSSPVRPAATAATAMAAGDRKKKYQKSKTVSRK